MNLNSIYLRNEESLNMLYDSIFRVFLENYILLYFRVYFLWFSYPGEQSWEI